MRTAILLLLVVLGCETRETPTIPYPKTIRPTFTLGVFEVHVDVPASFEERREWRESTSWQTADQHTRLDVGLEFDLHKAWREPPCGESEPSLFRARPDGYIAVCEWLREQPRMEIVRYIRNGKHWFYCRATTEIAVHQIRHIEELWTFCSTMTVGGPFADDFTPMKTIANTVDDDASGTIRFQITVPIGYRTDPGFSEFSRTLRSDAAHSTPSVSVSLSPGKPVPLTVDVDERGDLTMQGSVAVRPGRSLECRVHFPLLTEYFDSQVEQFKDVCRSLVVLDATTQPTGRRRRP